MSENRNICRCSDCQLHAVTSNAANLNGDAKRRKDHLFVASTRENKHGDASYAEWHSAPARHESFTANRMPAASTHVFAQEKDGSVTKGRKKTAFWATGDRRSLLLKNKLWSKKRNLAVSYSTAVCHLGTFNVTR